MSYNADVLVMDEPTAALSETEIEDLFRIIRQLRESGVGIVYISHRMDEIKRITDRITVMRDGQYIDTVSTAEVTTQDIISKMVGRQIYETSKPERTAGERETVLEVIGLNQGRTLKDINLTLKRGNSWHCRPRRRGTNRACPGHLRRRPHPIRRDPRAWPQGNDQGPHDAVRQGIGYLSEDRKRYGCVVDLDVKSNVAIASYGSFLRPGGWMNTARIREQAEDMVSRLKVKTPHVDQEVKFLSGAINRRSSLANG